MLRGLLPDELQAVVTDNIGAALTVSDHLGPDGAPLVDAALPTYVSPS